MRIILPKWRVDYIFDVGFLPVFFLAGPIRGGGGWQQRMCLELRRLMNPHDFIIAAPMRETEMSGFEDYYIYNKEDDFDRQLAWEQYYLTIASKEGCIIFWLPEQDKTNPRTDGSPYARDTYGELGEWRGRTVGDRSIKMVVGAEERFPGLSVIQRNFQSVVPDFVIQPTLVATAEAACRLVWSKYDLS